MTHVGTPLEYAGNPPDLTDPAGIRLNPIDNQGGEREERTRRRKLWEKAVPPNFWWRQTMQIGSKAADAGGSLNRVRRAADDESRRQRRKGRAADEVILSELEDEMPKGDDLLPASERQKRIAHLQVKLFLATDGAGQEEERPSQGRGLHPDAGTIKAKDF
ncbi:hypothetical protein ZIOFF_066217 [Zingiber officinale]|uniref:Uncharacterized protein n=1 Tax=Zingiber officinale TaxID=94328 RepID=A0A8J5F176_ZINOF|nr:hypothetical protein ZIOFF_066217 [Zingiber officinale]